MDCVHQEVTCINDYELIRKYRCKACEQVMMCDCDEQFGKEFLPHQLDYGTEIETSNKIPVAIGFQPKVCNECKGLPAEPHPKAEIYGATSKIKRYYWRELYFEETKLFVKWAYAEGYKDLFTARRENPQKYSEFARQALTKIKQLHKDRPKYQWSEESQSAIIAKFNVQVETVDLEYVTQKGRPYRIKYKEALFSVEDFAIRHYQDQGFYVLQTESIPFHVLFGDLTSDMIQDPEDERVREIWFGRRDQLPSNTSSQMRILLPEDFGKLNYAKRRKEKVDEFFDRLPKKREELLDLFDLSLHKSAGLRQYLWAHEVQNIGKARKVLEILPAEKILVVLRHLLNNYWENYLGWPDLLISKDIEYSFVEVKGSGDRLSDVQKGWIARNSGELGLPFKILKVQKLGKTWH